MSLPSGHNGSQAPNGVDVPQPDQTKLLEALRQQAVKEQLHKYAAQKEQQMAAAPPAAPVEEDSTYTLASLGTKKIHEIKDILRVMGKRVTGNKEDLIARILGLEESIPSPSKSKKRNADEVMDGEGSDGETDDGDQPPAKKFKVDRNDPIWQICFICQSKDNLNKYKDIRMCGKCKAYWKGKRLTTEDAQLYFLLKPEDLAQLPHKDTPANGGAPAVPLYAFATLAGCAVRKFGSLYHMVKDHPVERDALAQTVLAERRFMEEQEAKNPTQPDFEGANAGNGEYQPGEHHFAQGS